jgi:hypothetical protein
MLGLRGQLQSSHATLRLIPNTLHPSFRQPGLRHNIHPAQRPGEDWETLKLHSV